MLGGDLSNSVAGRFVFVFEGLVGRLPEKQEGKARLLNSLGQYRRVLDLYRIDPALEARIWDVAWRHDVRIDFVTFLGPRYEEPLRDRVGRTNLPVSNVMAYTAMEFSKRLAYVPDVLRVFDADPHRAVLAWGHRGVWVDEPSTFRPMAS